MQLDFNQVFIEVFSLSMCCKIQNFNIVNFKVQENSSSLKLLQQASAQKFMMQKHLSIFMNYLEIHIYFELFCRKSLNKQTH